ncbi:hypothetical protein SEVIR_8G106900v4 [Setaria viridis]
MAGPRPLLRRILRLAAAFAVAACACFPAPVSGIRKDSFIEPIICRSTVQGRHLISDDNGNTPVPLSCLDYFSCQCCTILQPFLTDKPLSLVGYVCSALSINPWSHCCPTTRDRFSCQGCKLDLQCCNSYEYCVSCCLNPSKTKKEDVLKLKVAKPVTAGTYTNVFDFCMGRCRHNSASVVHENAYASDFHHCFAMQQNSSGSTESSSVSKLLGINVVVGRPGESCSLVCKVRGQSCVPSRLSVLNKCEILQKYMRCKSGCFRSLGPDQPAEVVDEAPTSLNPGACLYMQMDERLTCDGSHQHTRRLCPCA